MPDYSGTLKKFRESGYPKESDKPSEPQEQSGVRSIKLSDEEAKELASYSQDPGQEAQCLVTGKIEGNTLRVMSVKSAGGGGPDVHADAEEMMSQFRQGQPAMPPR